MSVSYRIFTSMLLHVTLTLGTPTCAIRLSTICSQALETTFSTCRHKKSATSILYSVVNKPEIEVGFWRRAKFRFRFQPVRRKTISSSIRCRLSQNFCTRLEIVRSVRSQSNRKQIPDFIRSLWIPILAELRLWSLRFWAYQDKFPHRVKRKTLTFM